MLKDHMEIGTCIVFIVSVFGAILMTVVSFVAEMDAVSTRAENKILKKELCRIEQSDYWCKK